MSEEESKANFEMEYNELCKKYRMYVLTDTYNFTVVTHEELQKLKENKDER